MACQKAGGHRALRPRHSILIPLLGRAVPVSGDTSRLAGHMKTIPGEGGIFNDKSVSFILRIPGQELPTGPGDGCPAIMKATISA